MPPIPSIGSAATSFAARTPHRSETPDRFFEEICVGAALDTTDRGAVVGLDQDSSSLDKARVHPSSPGAGSIVYAVADLSGALPTLGRFDAIVGRRVLMYLPDPQETLMKACESLTAGGIVACQEHAATGMPVAAVTMPFHEQIHRWTWETVAREGGNVAMGLTLAPLLRQVGLTIDVIRSEGILLDGTNAPALSPIIRAMTPRMLRHGVATVGEIDIETLDLRLAEERRSTGAVLLWDMAYLVSARNDRWPIKRN